MFSVIQAKNMLTLFTTEEILVGGQILSHWNCLFCYYLQFIQFCYFDSSLRKLKGKEDAVCIFVLECSDRSHTRHREHH